MKQCPVCYSGRVKEIKERGLCGMVCLDCGYDSLAKDRSFHDHQREREREEKGRERIR